MGIRALASGSNRRLRCYFSILLISSFSFFLFWHKDYLIPKLQLSPASYNYSIGLDRERLTKKPRVLCMIMTTISNWETKGKAVRNTWAQRCHRAIIFYTKVVNWNASSITKEPNATGLDVPDGRGHLTAKTFAAIDYSYFNYASEVDVFLKADDDSYIIMENLQRIISKFNSTPLLFLGRRRSHKLSPNGYHVGGAGYVIGKEAAKMIVERRSSFPKDCPKDGTYEDVFIARCLWKLGIYPADGLDEAGRPIFHYDNPLQELWRKRAYVINFGDEEPGNRKTNSRGFKMSRWTASVHHVSASEIYMFDFWLYRLKRESTGSDWS